MSTKNYPPLRDYEPRRIAFIKPSALGDVIHALPVLTALRQRYPRAHITWIVNKSYAELLHGHPDLDEVLPFDRNQMKAGWSSLVFGYAQFCRLLKQQSFDLTIDLQGLLRSGVMTWATGASRRVGLSTSREGAGWFYTDVVKVPDPKTMHAVDRYWLVAESLGAGNGTPRFHLPVAEAERGWALETLQGCPRPWLMVGVGTRWVTKRWPVEHFGTLLRKAQDRFGGTAIFVGGPDETDLARKVARRLRDTSCDLTGRTSLPRLAAVLSLADVMVANDSGPLHIAVALGRPVVAPYTCTKVALTGPYGCSAGAVQTRVWCQGSLLKTCDRMECMDELTPYRLWPILQETLGKWERTCRSA